LKTHLAILRSLGALTWSAENLTPLVLGVLVLAAVIHCFRPRWFEISAEWLPARLSGCRDWRWPP
jgi:hypothetical protein